MRVRCSHSLPAGAGRTPGFNENGYCLAAADVVYAPWTLDAGRYPFGYCGAHSDHPGLPRNELEWFYLKMGADEYEVWTVLQS